MGSNCPRRVISHAPTSAASALPVLIAIAGPIEPPPSMMNASCPNSTLQAIRLPYINNTASAMPPGSHATLVLPLIDKKRSDR